MVSSPFHGTGSISSHAKRQEESHHEGQGAVNWAIVINFGGFNMVETLIKPDDIDDFGLLFWETWGFNMVMINDD